MADQKSITVEEMRYQIAGIEPDHQIVIRVGDEVYNIVDEMVSRYDANAPYQGVIELRAATKRAPYHQPAPMGRDL